MRTMIAGVVVGWSLFCGSLPAQEKALDVAVTISKDITGPTPVCVPLTLTPEQAKWALGGIVITDGGLPGQLVRPSLMTEQIKPATADGIRRDLYFVLDKKPAGTTVKLKFGPNTTAIAREHFEWRDNKGEFTDLVWLGADKKDDIKVLRYMYKAYDDSSADKRNKTYKVFHHLFDPAGKRLVTNGGHTDDYTDAKKLTFPHHRGLQMGFNKVTYANGKKKADTWHCQKDDHQSHEGFLQAEAGLLLARQRVAIDWHGDKKEVMVKEEREMTVYKLPGGTLVEFASRLKPVGGKVKLDGDPQHAGFQFRAANEVAEKTAKQTYYLRPDGKGKPGETRNWPKQIGHVNLPWNAMSFVIGGQRYTVCYLDQPSNPHETRHSERDYARFGCYFEYELTPENPLLLNYRIWLQEGEMTVEQVQALSNQFVSPPKVAAK